MVFGRPELGRGRVIEHGTTATGRWLRSRRLSIAAWIALVEGVLVVLHVIPRWPALLVAGAVIAFYLAYGRHSGSDALRQGSWIAAASQAVMALVPVLVIIVSTLAVIAVALLAVVALIILFRDRR